MSTKEVLFEYPTLEELGVREDDILICAACSADLGSEEKEDYFIKKLYDKTPVDDYSKLYVIKNRSKCPIDCLMTESVKKGIRPTGWSVFCPECDQPTVHLVRDHMIIKEWI
jgi:hypothetical protein